MRAAFEGVDAVFLSGADDPRRVEWETGAIDIAAAAGPMLGRPPTGQPVELAAIVIFRIADGKLAERWAGWKPGFDPARRS